MKTLPYELVPRTCKCGCGGKFRVLKGSSSWYWSQTHNGVQKNWNYNPIDKKHKKLKGPKPKKEIKKNSPWPIEPYDL